MDQLSCPFCGSSKVKIQVNQTYFMIKASGRCNSCHARGPLFSKPIDVLNVEELKNAREYVTSEALKHWNNRI